MDENLRDLVDRGLLPREKYCSDIETPVISLNANANCWRGLRDMATVLTGIGDTDQADKLQVVAASYRKDILATIDKALDRSVDPPFLPIAVGEETAHDPARGVAQLYGLGEFRELGGQGRIDEGPHDLGRGNSQADTRQKQAGKQTEPSFLWADML